MLRTAARALRGERGTGHVANGADPRDRRWSLGLVGGSSAPSGFGSLEAFIQEVLDQGAANSCVGAMLRSMVAICEAIAGRPYKPLSNRALYKLARAKDGITADIGCRIRTAAEVLRRHGVPFDADVPYSVLGINAGIPATKLVGGWSNSRFGYAHIDHADAGERLAVINDALRSGHPVGFGAPVDRRYMEWTGKNTYNLSEKVSDRVGNHAQLIVAPADAQGRYRVLGSYGRSWGDHGLIWVSTGYIAKHALDLTVGHGFDRAAGAS